MNVLNVHQRELPASAARAGALLDSLASAEDALWPHHSWPPMRFDRPLGVGAVGGHGPIRYVVEEHRRGEQVRFRFTAPAGFDGYHLFEVLPLGPARTLLRHTLAMQATGTARLTWALVFRPLHDALVEDAFTAAEIALGASPQVRPWSAWVKALRWTLKRGRTIRREASGTSSSGRATDATGPGRAGGPPQPNA